MFNQTDDNITASSPSRPSVDRTFLQIFYVYISGLLIIIGLVTNILIVYIMKKPTFTKLPISVYFSALACSDLLAVVLASILQILMYYTGHSFFNRTTLCTTCGFIFSLALMTSSWLIVCLAVERFLVVKYPLKAKQLSTKRKAHVVVVSCLLVGILINSYRIWMVDYNSTYCTDKPEYVSFYKMSGIFVALTNTAIPTGIIWVFYMMLLYLIYKTKGVASSNASEKKKEKLTSTALFICLAFLVFSTPHAVYITIARHNNWIIKPTAESMMINAITSTLTRLNYSTNFFIYVATNSQFRNIVRNMFRLSDQVLPVQGGTSVVQP